MSVLRVGLLLAACVVFSCTTASAWILSNGTNAASGEDLFGTWLPLISKQNEFPTVIATDSASGAGGSAGYLSSGTVRQSSLGASSLANIDGLSVGQVQTEGSAQAEFSDTGPTNSFLDRVSSWAIIRLDIKYEGYVLSDLDFGISNTSAGVTVQGGGDTFSVTFGNTRGDTGPVELDLNVTDTREPDRPFGYRYLSDRSVQVLVHLFDTDIGEAFPDFTASTHSATTLTDGHSEGRDALGSAAYFTRVPISVAACPTGGLVCYDNYTYGDPLPELIEGDFNFDGEVDELDIDLLTNEILTTSGSIDEGDAVLPASSFLFDITLDGLVDSGDTNYLIRDVIGTEYGDANLDLKVDLLDLDILGANFGSSGGWGEADFNGDNTVDLLDLDILGTYFGFDGTSGAAIPEPHSLLLAVVALCGLRRRN